MRVRHRDNMSFEEYLQKNLKLNRADKQEFAKQALADFFAASKGVVPTSTLEKILEPDSDMSLRYGSEELNKAWEDLYDGKFVDRDMTKDEWVWVKGRGQSDRFIANAGGNGIDHNAYAGNMGSMPFRGRGTGPI